MTLRCLRLASLWCVLTASAALAQDPTGAIEGAVTGATAAAVGGATVVAKNLETGFTRQATATSDGVYRLTALPVGPYSVTVDAPPFGSHTVDEWVSRSAFERLNIATQAGEFGNAGRNIVRGPGYANLDVSLMRTLAITSTTRLEARIESFNVTNHVTLGLPVADLNSANFGESSRRVRRG